MTYTVKEIFKTLQGEGVHAGRAAVFCRFTGCNLWSGREVDRKTAACNFCDTDFVGYDRVNGGKFSNAEELVMTILEVWGCAPHHRFVVFTGGEPLLQLDQALIQNLHDHHFVVAIETNGTLLPPPGVDWICVSPKGNSLLKLDYGNELKLVFPQPAVSPDIFEKLDFEHFFLQPMDGSARTFNTNLAVQYCLEHPQWQLSLQTHKYIGIL